MSVNLEVPVDVRVSQGLHPQNVVAAVGDDYDDETKGDVAQVIEAFDGAYKAISRTFDARIAAANDITLTTPAQVLATADFADRAFQNAAARIDRVSANMRSSIAAFERDLSGPMDTGAAGRFGAEIRAHVAGLPSDKRLGFIQAAINRGDFESASAVLAAPAYLSGIDDAMQTTLTRMWHARANPMKEKKLRACRAALDLLDRNSGLLIRDMTKAVGDYEDPKTKRRITPQELRKVKQQSAKAFAQLGS